MTVGQWLDIWVRDYLTGVKASTAENYRYNIRLHIKPALGAVRLADLHPHAVQGFINDLGLAPTTTALVCGILSGALEKAVELGVEEVVLFCNSPLERLTDNGKAHLDQKRQIRRTPGFRLGSFLHFMLSAVYAKISRP